MSFITLNNGELEVTINSFGAEIFSIKDNNGREYLWQGDPTYWKDRAPILFPIVSGLENGKYTFEGKEYALSSHGFAKKCEFEVESANEICATFLLKSNEQTKACYPFDFEFRAGFKLSGKKIIVDFETKNTGKSPMYYSTGAHEGFALSGGVENYSIILDEAETLKRYEVLPSGVIGDTPLDCFENSSELKLNDDYFAVDALIFFDIKSRGITLRDDRNGEKIHVAFPGFDTLLVWKRPGGEYVCIEPWAGAPDLSWKRVDDFSEKYRIRKVEAGGSETLTHTITF